MATAALVAEESISLSPCALVSGCAGRSSDATMTVVGTRVKKNSISADGAQQYRGSSLNSATSTSHISDNTTTRPNGDRSRAGRRCNEDSVVLRRARPSG